MTENKYFSRAREKHRSILYPVHWKVGLKRHRQLPIFDGQEGNHHVKMGLFYELMTSALFGGALIDRIIRIDREETKVGCKPDIMSRKRSEVHESKAVKQGAHLNLLSDQIGRYTALQIINPKFDVYFVVWRHTIKGIISRDRSEYSFRSELGTSTIAGIKIPLSLISAMYHCSSLPQYFRKYETPSWNTVSVKSPYLNNLLLDTQNTISKIADPSDYKWECYKTPPSGLKVDNVEISSFPLIVIKDRTRSWVERLITEAPF